MVVQQLMRKFSVIFQRLIETLVQKVLRKSLMDLHLRVTTAENFLLKQADKNVTLKAVVEFLGLYIILIIKTWLLLKIILSLKEIYLLLYILILTLQHPQIIISIQNKQKCFCILRFNCLLLSKIKYSKNNCRKELCTFFKRTYLNQLCHG